MAKKDKPLSASMQDCLKRFGGKDYKLPHGKDIRICEALWLRGLLEGEHVCVEQRVTSEGTLRTFRNAFRKPRKESAAAPSHKEKRA